MFTVWVRSVKYSKSRVVLRTGAGVDEQFVSIAEGVTGRSLTCKPKPWFQFRVRDYLRKECK